MAEDDMRIWANLGLWLVICSLNACTEATPAATVSPTAAITAAAAACEQTAYVSGNPPDANTAKLTDTWYANEWLWAGLVPPFRGVWYAGGVKVGWWRAVPGPLAIAGKRLDAAAPPLRADIPDGYGPSGFQSTGIDFPTAGCWQVVGSVGDKSLRFVVHVLPASENPTRSIATKATDTQAAPLATPTAVPTPTPAPDLPAIWVLDSSGNRWLAVDPQTGKTLNQISRMLGLTTSLDGRWRYVLQAQLQDRKWRADVIMLDLTRSASVRRISLASNVPDSSQVDRTISTSGVILSRDERQLYATASEFAGAQWVTRVYVIDLTSQTVARSFDIFRDPAAREAPLTTRAILASDQRRLFMIQSAERQPRVSQEVQTNWFTRIAVINLQDGNVERTLEVPGDIQAHGFGPDAVLSPDGQWLYLMQAFSRSAAYAGYRFVAVDVDRFAIVRNQTVEKANGGEEFSYFQVGLTLTPDGRYLVGYNGDTRNITHEYFQFLDTQTGLVTQKVRLERMAKPGSFDLSELLLSPDKRLVYVAFATSREVFTLDLAQRQIVLSAVLQDPKSAAPHPIDRLLRAVSNWLVSTASAKMNSWPGAVLSPDGQRMYFVGIKDFENGEGVWAVETATLKTIGHWLIEKDIGGIRLSADGRELYAASPSDNVLYVLDALTGEARRTLKLEFRPDGFVTAQTF